MSGGFINLRVVGQDGKPHAEGRLYQPKAKSAAETLGETAGANPTTNSFEEITQPYQEDLEKQRQEEWERQQEEAMRAMVKKQLDALNHSPNASGTYNDAINNWIARHGREYKSENELGEAIKRAFKMNDQGETIDYQDDEEVLDLLLKRRRR